MASFSGPRVLVHLRRHLTNPDQTVTVLGKFSQCIVDYLNQDETKTSETSMVKCCLEGGKLVIEKAEDGTGHILRHPPFCPIRMMSPVDIAALPEDISMRGINVGIVAVVESSDERVLITRRAPHMRTFPGVWVPPGGGIDHGETLIETCLRELSEETGLTLKDEEMESNDCLCLWESVYPPFLDWGSPKRHHLVVYYHLKLLTDWESLCKRMVLQREEVDAACWLSTRHVAYVMEGQKLDGMEDTFRMLTLPEGGKQTEVDCQVDVLAAKAPKDGGNGDVERVSSGTRFALSEWLKKKTERSCDAKL